MPKYYLHIRDVQRIEDPEGGDYRDLAHARREAVTAIREIAAERVRTGAVLGRPGIDICDESGQHLASVAFEDAVRLR